MKNFYIDNNQCLVIEVDELSSHPLHPLWIRERISGSEHIDKNNYQRLYEPSLIDQGIKFQKVSIKNGDIFVEFSDQQKGNISITSIINEIHNIDVIPKQEPWNSNLSQLPKHNYLNFEKDKTFIVKMLEDFIKYGFVIIYNLPKEEGTVIKFAESLGPVRSTNFGKHFDVISKPNPNDLAYTAMGLSAHTDNPYRKPIPGIQLLHCIENSASGGDSTLVDGLAIEKYLRKNDYKSHEILSQTEILFRFTDKDTILENRGKLIELDDKDNFKQIRFSGRLDYVPLISFKDLTNFYKARKKLYQLYSSKVFEIKFRLENGMLVMFDNHRLLHGRTEYDPSSGHRHLQGCYIEHDVTEGKLRRLLVKN